MRTLALVRADQVMAGASVEAQSFGTIIDVVRAVRSRPTVDAGAHEATGLIVARSPVHTRVLTRLAAFVHVLST